MGTGPAWSLAPLNSSTFVDLFLQSIQPIIHLQVQYFPEQICYVLAVTSHVFLSGFIDFISLGYVSRRRKLRRNKVNKPDEKKAFDMFPVYPKIHVLFIN